VLPTPPGKERITIRLDTDILAWFRRQADEQGGGNYQTMINQALRSCINGQELPIEDLLRPAPAHPSALALSSLSHRLPGECEASSRALRRDQRHHLATE
jgi:hypothetical protein